MLAVQFRNPIQQNVNHFGILDGLYTHRRDMYIHINCTLGYATNESECFVI